MEANLQNIFDNIRAEFAVYEQPPMVARTNRTYRYELWSEKTIELNGKPRSEVYFGGLIIQSNYVGFYFMPVYTYSEATELFSPELLKLLKGKSCFHIKKLTPELLADIRTALKTGYDLYKSRGWV